MITMGYKLCESRALNCCIVWNFMIHGSPPYPLDIICGWLKMERKLERGGTQILLHFEERRWIYNPFFRKYLERERNTLKKDFP